MEEFYTWGWGIILAAFAGLEVAALSNKDKGDTFSEHVWKWFGIRGRSTSDKVLRTSFLGFMVWLTAHFMDWV